MTLADPSEEALVDPVSLAKAKALAGRVEEGLNKALLGQEALTRTVLTGFLARGHILLEGLPGLGKTELVKSLARLLALEFKRVQFTPDLLPGDITGTPILQETAEGRRLVFSPGPVFTNLLLADEINRASPKTQSALLEAMQEGRVTVFGETRALPAPFFVLATQNPIELEGTYPLPEAQIDRFLFKVDVPGVGVETLSRIVSTRRRGEAPALDPILRADELASVLAVVGRIHIPSAVADYIARLVAASHPEEGNAPAPVKTYVRYGASPRAAIAIAEASRACALLRGKPNVGFAEVEEVLPHALGHRLVLEPTARLDRVTGAGIVEALRKAVPAVAERLPAALREAGA